MKIPPILGVQNWGYISEEGDPIPRYFDKKYEISIHALREEGDSKNRDKISIFKQIIQHSARI